MPVLPLIVFRVYPFACPADVVRACGPQHNKRGSCLHIPSRLGAGHGHKKREETPLLTSPLLGGGYLRLPMPLTVGAGTLRALCQEREAGGNIAL